MTPRHALVRFLSAAVLSAVVVPTTYAVAAPTTCAGREATVVGTGERTLRGTAGPDVILTEGSRWVDGLGGDDVVCVTGPSGATREVDAGDGDDEVRGATGDLLVYLGAGADTFVGGPGDEHVSTFEGSETDEPDVARTGAGDDVVEAGAYEVDLRDVIDLGPGRDQVALAGRVLAAGASLTGGDGSDELYLRYTDTYLDDVNLDPDADLDWTFVNGTPSGTSSGTSSGTATAGGVQKLAWTGFERFELLAVAESYSFVGGPADEVVVADNLATARMGEGDDLVRTYDAPPSGAVSGGPGRDRVDLGFCDGATVVDLAAARYRCTDGRRVTRWPLSGVEEVGVRGQQVAVRGTARSDRIVVQACRGTVHGLGGGDVLRARDRDEYFTGVLGACQRRFAPRPLRLSGDAGPDVLRGSRAADVLLGGAGRDAAYGGRGRDTCRAERRVACES